MKRILLPILAMFLFYSCTLPETDKINDDNTVIDNPDNSNDPVNNDTTDPDSNDPTDPNDDQTGNDEPAEPVTPPADAEIEGWTFSWSDEFNDGVFDTNTWTRQVLMVPFNGEWQKYTGGADTAYEEDGNMVIKASLDAGKDIAYGNFTSARVISNPGGQNGLSDADGKTFKYGKIRARIKLPYGKGIWPAFWMLGDNISETGGDTGWPQCGEIDILETGSVHFPNYGQGTVQGTLHHDPSVDNSGDWSVNEYLQAGDYTLPNEEYFGEDYHIFEIEWDEEQIIWLLDDVQFGSMSIAESSRSEFHKDFYVIFNIAVGGHFTATPDDTTDFPQYMYIDWIRHYTKS